MTTTIGSLVLDLHSTDLLPEEKELIAHPLVGGVILFARNYHDKLQLHNLCAEIRNAKQSPLVIMVDQEGGRVQRFVTDFTPLPAFSYYGDMFDHDQKAASQAAHKMAMVMASELLAVGIDFSISPVIDLNKGLNTVIGNRAFHRDPGVVTTLANAFIDGMHQTGMAAVAKHFPGHGSVVADSHLELPIDARNLNAVLDDDLIPFIKLSPHLKGMMMSHLSFPAIDDSIVGFSRYWVQIILRQQLQFKGAILSDDLHMQGANISAFAPDRFLAARNAGCDFVLYCNDRTSIVSILDHIPATHHQLPETTWRLLAHHDNA